MGRVVDTYALKVIINRLGIYTTFNFYNRCGTGQTERHGTTVERGRTAVGTYAYYVVVGRTVTKRDDTVPKFSPKMRWHTGGIVALFEIRCGF